MKRLAMIGTHLIHTYPYGAWFNGCDQALFEQNAKPWMVKIYEGEPAERHSDAVRLTHVWGGERDEAEKLAAACLIPHVADRPDEMADAVDGAMVMDENIEERAPLMRPYLEAGKAVFVDKILSLDPAVTRELLDTAQRTGARLAAWSQLRFAPGFEPIRELGRGGIALATFRLPLDKLPAYGIHLVSAVHGLLGAGATAERLADGPAGPQLLLSYPDGTRALLYIAPDAPPQWNLYYAAPKGAVHATTGSSRVMFERSAAAIESMLVEGAQPVAPAEIAEATALVRLLCQP